MSTKVYRIAVLVLAASLPAAGVHAQLEGLLNKGGTGQSGTSGSGGSSGTGLKDLAGGLTGHMPASGSVGNVAGLLQYCVNNNYLIGGGAEGVREKLMGKVPGASTGSDPGYSDGAKGVLHSTDGKQMDLSGGGLKAGATKKVCDAVLAQGKSLL
jgi:hypothetical protein